MADTRPRRGRSRRPRPPFWILSVLVAAAVLIVIVQHRPVSKPVVSAQPAASVDTSPPAPVHRATARSARSAKQVKPPVTTAPGALQAPIPAQIDALPETGVPAVATPATTAPATAPLAPLAAPAPTLMGTLPRTD